MWTKQRAFWSLVPGALCKWNLLGKHTTPTLNIRWLPLYLQKRRKIFKPQWPAPFKGLAFINPEQLVIFLVNISKEPVLLFWKKQMSKEMFDAINEQWQRKSYSSSMSHMRKQFSEQRADSLVFNNSLFFVLHRDLISLPTAGESEHLKGEEPSIEICRSHTKVQSSLRVHFWAVMLTTSVN